MRTRLIALQLAAYSVFFIASVNAAPTFEPAGSEDEVKYARSLWKELSRLQRVGDQARPLAVIYGGARPHGTYLQLASQNVSINGHQGFLVLKKNHSGEGITEQQVVDHPTRYLQSITVMYQREQGYDVDNQNWFWVKT
jgi:hypothetical protein